MRAPEPAGPGARGAAERRPAVARPAPHARGTAPRAIAAIDLGATSGRVMLGIVADGRIEMVPARRFENRLERVDGNLCWDLDALWAEIRHGLTEAHDLAVARGLEGLDSIGVDSWAVDYALVGPEQHEPDGSPTSGPGPRPAASPDPRRTASNGPRPAPSSGRRHGEVIAYRDDRTDGIAEQFAVTVSRERQYALTGIAQQPFNTLYQLVADDRLADLPVGTTLLMLPDAIGHLLTGRRRTELTNASSTGMLAVGGADWAEELLTGAGIDPELLAPFIAPGELLGTVRPDLGTELGIGEVTVIAVGSHDTASAVLAVPATGTGTVAYISSGTWSLIGLELTGPVATPEALEAGFTNEGGVDGTIRFLQNVAGMWLVSESIRQWQDEGLDVDLETLLTAAAAEPPARALIDPTDPQFLAPGGMADRVIAAARPVRADRADPPDPTDPAGPGGLANPADPAPERPTESSAVSGPLPDAPALTTPAQVVRCILESLALTYRDQLATACRIAGVPKPDRLHVVGGGSRNALLNRLTADALGIEVVAGPMEATALGNLALQAAALGAVPADRGSIRELVRASVELETFRPPPR
ncbi:rhamnulokinase family protein [Brachybacterium sp. P6-10-X1]|uniref:rhamnulokinase n=1 Tax=Brachybacterium sp. P6-10-X1 TaxID=1903186 RepID=UPI0009FA057F|nr:rhamnulokinase family protein [Brachybacterium sp. P6-10-X1]